MWLLLSEGSEGLYCSFCNCCSVLSLFNCKLLEGRSCAAFTAEYQCPAQSLSHDGYPVSLSGESARVHTFSLGVS